MPINWCIWCLVSLAVGDVEYLRNTSQDKILRIKLNFVIEALQLAKALDIPFLSSIHTNPTNNMLVVSYEGSHFAKVNPSFNRVFDERRESIAGQVPPANLGFGKMMNPSSTNRSQNIHVGGIPEHKSTFEVPEDESTCCRRAKQWFIGLEWKAYLELY
ncbi:hypothetical protein PRIPAC_86082 [Pristionchus pacificus]|uniref:Uncharacterized protein n=1 Tax=Pristionchus pacificus TaxID=54126 RepID=A0A2A6BSS3_PRIPA|nr:hypothetical protein PRIPAC_86082 [Pristionchus pacificus]|eukprot:PDM68907.1 hypothetical protein PRIPAC_47209 [Pristionchus pacificus]